MPRHSPTGPGAAPEVPREPLFGLVVAVYDTARFLPEFLASLEAQDWPEDEVDLVLVDDGSTDESRALIAEWLAGSRFHGRLLTQDNAGPGAARNRGLDAVRGQWVSFPDSDDVLDPAYLREVGSFIRRGRARDAALVAARLVRFTDDVTRPIQPHSLDFKYADPERVVDLSQSPRFIQLHSNVGFYRREVVEATGLRFDERIRPVFEDAVLTIDYLRSVPRPTVAFLRSARYYYRRRVDGTSLTNSPRRNPSAFAELPLHGYLGVLERHGPRPPWWVQNTVYYDLHWMFRAEQQARPDRCPLDAEALDTFHDLLDRILAHLDAATILEFDAVDIPARIRLALLARKGADLPGPQASVVRLDPEMRLVLVSYLTEDPEPTEEVLVDGVRTDPVYAKTTSIRFFDRTWLHQRDLWLPSVHHVALRVDGRPVPLVHGPLSATAFTVSPREVWRRHGGQALPPVAASTGAASTGAEAPGAEAPDDGAVPPAGVTDRIAEQLSRPAVAMGTRLVRAAAWSARLAVHGVVPVVGESAREGEGFAGAVRRRASSARSRRTYRHAWVLLDRDTMAQDNAEALYRYLRAHQPDVNAWFALSPQSPDWPRLEADGFRLLAYGSVEYAVALRNADYLLSSQADTYVLRPRGRFYGRRGWQFVFLQHGVIDKDLSSWLNTLPIRLMLTTTEAEHRAVVGDGSPYLLSDKEVERTGLPRHDRLLRLAGERRATDRRSLLVAPTWRAHLMAPQQGGHHRELAVDLTETSFLHGWRRLLERPALAALAEEHDLDLVLLAHPHLQAHLTAELLPAGVRVVTSAEADVQRLIVSARLLVTDYSSLAFDTAYVGTPCVYYQFDAEDFFSGQHTARQGPFRHDRDGFGPVVRDADAAVAAAAALLDPGSGAAEPYRRRMEQTLTLRDGQCCARAYAAIRRREVPVPDTAPGAGAAEGGPGSRDHVETREEPAPHDGGAGSSGRALASVSSGGSPG